MSEVRNAGVRYRFVRKLLNREKDKDGLELLEDLLKNCSNYVSYVAGMESKIQLAKLENDTKKYIKLVETLDAGRKIVHNALIGRLLALNRYLFRKYGKERFPAGGIFSLDPLRIKDRVAVGDWAGYLVQYLKSRLWPF